MNMKLLPRTEHGHRGLRQSRRVVPRTAIRRLREPQDRRCRARSAGARRRDHYNRN